MEKAVILIIDDDQNMSKSLADIFRVKGYEVLAAGSGAEGLALLEQQFINLALIDLGLPDISGLDVLERMKASSPATEAIVLTGQASVDSAVEAANRGAYSYMLKPYDMNLLLLHVKRAMEKQRTEKALRLRQRAIDASSNGIMIVDITLPDNPIVYANPAFEQITGYSSEEALGRNSRILSRDDGEQMGVEEIRAALREQRDGHAVLRNYRKDGSLFWNALSVAPVRDDGGKVTHFVGIINDITEQKRYEAQLEYQATHDSLTALPNRNLLADRISQAVAYGQRHRSLVAVLFIDLDFFKFINDSLGHQKGDVLLKMVAERLTKHIRRVDTLAHQGGDKFVVTLVDLKKSEDATLVAHNIQETLAQPFEIEGQEAIISCSIGISIYPTDGEDAQTLVKNAEVAMYRAKEQGRNNFRYYTRELNDRVASRMAMEKQLRKALENDEFELHYQPQADLNTGHICGMEALLRWRNPELGMVSPAGFIPLAEETGLIVPIGEWVVKTACEQNKRWQDAGLLPLTVAVNLSPRQFREKELTGVIARLLRETGLEPRWLGLEIVESMVMQDVESSTAMLNDLKALGVELSMDDFGTGYSSLSYLKLFPVAKLKIDISFVRDIMTDPGSAAIAKSIIAMAHNLNLSVIAEGVETEGQLEFLRVHGCDAMQGYYFSRPLPAGDFEELLRGNRRLQLRAEADQIPENTLLLVDDDPYIIEAFEQILSMEGYHVLTGENAAQGFELLAGNSVGVIICDERLPGMSGTEFLSRTKKFYPDTVRIALSGYADLDVVTAAVNRGAIYKFLTKPLREDELLETVREAFMHYKADVSRKV